MSKSSVGNPSGLGVKAGGNAVAGGVVVIVVAFWPTITPVRFTLYHLVRLLSVVADGRQASLAVISFTHSLIEV